MTAFHVFPPFFASSGGLVSAFVFAMLHGRTCPLFSFLRERGEVGRPAPPGRCWLPLSDSARCSMCGMCPLFLFCWREGQVGRPARLAGAGCPFGFRPMLHVRDVPPFSFLLERGASGSACPAWQVIFKKMPEERAFCWKNNIFAWGIHALTRSRRKTC